MQYVASTLTVRRMQTATGSRGTRLVRGGYRLHATDSVLRREVVQSQQQHVARDSSPQAATIAVRYCAVRRQTRAVGELLEVGKAPLPHGTARPPLLLVVGKAPLPLKVVLILFLDTGHRLRQLHCSSLAASGQRVCTACYREVHAIYVRACNLRSHFARLQLMTTHYTRCALGLWYMYCLQ